MVIHHPGQYLSDLYTEYALLLEPAVEDVQENQNLAAEINERTEEIQAKNSEMEQLRTEQKSMEKSISIDAKKIEKLETLLEHQKKKLEVTDHTQTLQAQFEAVHK